MHENEINDIKLNQPKSSLKTRRVLREIFSWFMWIGGAVAFAVIVNSAVIVNAKVISGSMEQTIMTGDRIVGSRMSYLFRDPDRFDVIVFRWPDNPQELPFVKRIIGLPGETVEIIQGRVYIDNALIPLDEAAHLAEDMRGNYGPFFVPEGAFFVLGDNRGNSEDSRSWQNQFVPRENILGKVILRIHPHFGPIR